MLGSSWKTTVAGIVSILTVLLTAVTQFLKGGIGTVSWEVLLTGIIAGIGLIVAKDADVTNSPTPGAARAVPPPTT